MELLGLHHTGFFVRDLARARRFYEGVLDMECILALDTQAFLRFGRGDELALFVDPEKAPTDGEEKLDDPHHKAHAAFIVTQATYDAAKGELRSLGRRFTTVDWGDHECLYFLDPDQNLLELNVRPEERGGNDPD